jgi:Ctr copper transporter family
MMNNTTMHMHSGGMPMAFHWSVEATVLFDWWKTDSWGGYLATCLAWVALTCLFEWLGQYRRKLERETKEAYLKRNQVSAQSGRPGSEFDTASSLLTIDDSSQVGGGAAVPLVNGGSSPFGGGGGAGAAPEFIDDVYVRWQHQLLFTFFYVLQMFLSYAIMLVIMSKFLCCFCARLVSRRVCCYLFALLTCFPLDCSV